MNYAFPTYVVNAAIYYIRGSTTHISTITIMNTCSTYTYFTLCCFSKRFKYSSRELILIQVERKDNR